MDNYSLWAGGAVFLIFTVSIIGIFKTKTPGFGKYTTSALVLVLVLFVAAFSFVLGKVEWTPLANLLFAAIGFAGGLITGKSTETKSQLPGSGP